VATDTQVCGGVDDPVGLVALVPASAFIASTQW
jgi:hypothetical protein